VTSEGLGDVDETDGREVRSSLARIERDVDRLDRKLDSFLTQHSAKHDTEQAGFNAHLLAASESMSRSLRNEAAVSQLDTRLSTVEDWRQAMLGAMSLMRLALGTSVLSAIVAIVTLIRIFVAP
jgi:hypothetical protein